jgi:hypothetical protein
MQNRPLCEEALGPCGDGGAFKQRHRAKDNSIHVQGQCFANGNEHLRFCVTKAV